MTQPAFDMKVRDLAERIYVDLLSGAVEVTADDVRVAANPSKLAEVSFKLAAAFHQEQDRLNAENLPKNQDFKLDVSDISAWNK